MTDPKPAAYPVHILEKDGVLLEKFELRGDRYVSLVDGRSMTREEATEQGWVHIAEQSNG